MRISPSNCVSNTDSLGHRIRSFAGDRGFNQKRFLITCVGEELRRGNEGEKPLENGETIKKESLAREPQIFYNEWVSREETGQAAEKHAIGIRNVIDGATQIWELWKL